jgi:hypothetical protein
MHKHHLSEEFDRFAADLAPRVVPAGPDAVRSAVRRRRRLAAASTTVAAVVLVGAPVLGYAALDRRGGPDQVAITPTPQLSGTPDSPAPTPQPTPTVASVVDGRIGSGELSNAWLTLPAWPVGAPAECKTANVRLADAGIAHRVELTSLGYADVDSDVAVETVAVLSCTAQTPAVEQAVVFDRDARGIVTGPQVANTDTSGMAWIAAVEAGRDGTVRLQVGDHQPCCGWQPQWIQRQWRTYKWQRGGFKQVDGRGRWPANPHPADLSATVSGGLTLTRNEVDGRRHGVVTVAIRNAGPATVSGARVAFDFAGRVVEAEAAGWAVCRQPVAPGPACELGEIRGGQTVTLRLGMVTDDAVTVAGTATVTVSRLADGGSPPDPDEGNDTDSLTYGP